MNRILIVLVVLTLGYVTYAWTFLAKDPSRPVLALIKDNAYEQIPTIISKSYLKLTDYSIAHQKIENSPSIPYLAIAYDLDGFKNKEILLLIEQFIDQGADINAQFEGYTALNSAVLANSPELVRFLLKKGAKTNITTQHENLEHCNGLISLEFALCINKLGKTDLTNIIEILQSKKT